MLTPDEIQAFVSEMKTDLKWLNTILTDRCRIYDRHIEEGVNVRERLTNTEIVAKRAANDIENILWRVIFGGIVASLVTAIIASVLMKGIN